MSIAEQTVVRGGDWKRLAGGLTLFDRLLVLVAIYFIALRLWFSFAAFPVADEAYYWLWGRHPGFSYFDHPPLAGWLQGITHAIFGTNLFALRLPALVCFAVVVLILQKVAVRVAGAEWRGMFLRSLVVYLASPVFFFFGSVVFIDYLLVALMMASGYLFFCYLGDVETKGQGRLRDLFGAAVLLGLAGLAKYNAGFLGVAVAGVVLTRPKLRPLLRDWPIYAAAAIAVAMQAPVLAWNLQHDFASFAFRANDPLGGGGTFTGINVAGMKAFVADTGALLSWALVPVIMRFFWSRPDPGFAQVGKTIAIWVFWLSSLTFLYISNYSWIQWWWNTAAFVLVIPFSGRYIGPFLLTLHVAWGGFINTLILVSLVVVPLSVLIGRGPFMETEAAYGWDEITAAVREVASSRDADFIATNRYQFSSQLAFALDDPEVTEISPRRDAFDDWFDAPAHAGQSAVVVVDGREDVTYWRSKFTAIEKIRDLAITRLGFPMRSYEVYFAKGYIP